jgi:hypothetical protein
MVRATKHEPPKSQWQNAQERWEAQLRLWLIEDEGGYRAWIEREIDGKPAPHVVWSR